MKIVKDPPSLKASDGQGKIEISELKEMAKKKGMLSMYQDGLIKVLQGTTTLDEVERVSEA